MVINWTPKYLRGQTTDATDEWVLAENVPGIWNIIVYPKDPRTNYPLNGLGAPHLLNEHFIWTEITKGQAFYYKVCSGQDLT
jgi:hypothetical protein